MPPCSKSGWGAFAPLPLSSTPLNLFSSSNIQNQWSSRISSLLEISIDCSDGHSPCVCDICKKWIVFPEKALGDLTAFKVLAKSALIVSCRKLEDPWSGVSMGVSPHTSGEWPPSQSSHRRLYFQYKPTSKWGISEHKAWIPNSKSHLKPFKRWHVLLEWIHQYP